MVSGAVADHDACIAALKRWLLRRGRQHLVPSLLDLADRHGFSVTRASVRLQRSRWGSFSRRGTVSLNARLLLLPPELVRYVMLHELCHSVHLDHSVRFWSLVGRLDPDCATHRRELHNACLCGPGEPGG